MELYLDSVDFNEIEEAFKLGFLAGLTTTPTFMHRQGITDIDGAILKLSKMVPVLQVEALGDTAEEVLAEAQRLLSLGLEKDKTVFKIPVSNEGVRACKMLRNEGMMVNVHLIYTLNQAYMAMAAGANYVCPLVGRLQDQGHDALKLVEQCTETVNHYGYDTKVMFSSVRYPEHIRTALLSKVHTITAPWKVMKVLTENVFTDLGTEQFVEHTKLMTVTVKEVIAKANPTVKMNETVFEALSRMTDSGLGAVTVLKESGELAGIFTDGDLRRNLRNSGKALLEKAMGDLVSAAKVPVTITSDALLYEAVKIFKETGVDNIIVTENNAPIGMIDIQDFVKMNLVG